MDQDAFDRRLAEVLEQERRDGPMPEGWLWWLSYVDPERAAPPGEQVPGGPGFLGVVVVEAPGPVHATVRASELGLNPGGEAKMFAVPAADVPPEYRYRLLSFAEAQHVNSLTAGD